MSSLPNHYMTSLKVHKTIIKLAVHSRRDYLWAKDADSTLVNSLAVGPQSADQNKKEV
jgi:hypothetical protein